LNFTLKSLVKPLHGPSSCTPQNMRVLFLSALALALTVRGDVNLRVRADGSGDYTSVQAALDSLAPRAGAVGRVTLSLLGVFRERVHIYANFTDGVALRGAGAAPTDALVIYNVAGARVGTFASWTMLVEASNVTLENVAVANDAGGYNKTVAGQSVALHVTGDFFVARDAALLGAQDTLYGGTQRLYLENVFINGSCDSAFGEGSIVFDGVASAIYDTVTAHRGEAPPFAARSAYLFLRSALRPTGGRSTFLGRPWGALAAVVLIDTELGAGIEPAAWEDWGHGCTNATTREKSATWCANVTYAEFNSSGVGAAPQSRVWWSSQLSAEEAAAWTPARVLGGWEPAARAAPAAWRAASLF
jgi:pectinesterase